MAWRFAIWPTSRSPSSVKPTIEGVVRAPSRFGITCGEPTSTTATQEFVVPRSMPRTFATLAPFRGRRGRHLDPGRPEQPVVQEVASLQDRENGPGRHGAGLLAHDRLVNVRVERESLRRNLR